MIFVRYELGSKGYQFWDGAHQQCEISHDVKFKESLFYAKEKSLAQPEPAPLSDHQFQKELNNDSNSDLDLVTLNQPPLGTAQGHLHQGHYPHNCLSYNQHHQEDNSWLYQMRELHPHLDTHYVLEMTLAMSSYIWEQYENKVVELYHIPGEEHSADLFAKSLPVVKVEKLEAMIGLT